MKRFKEWLFEWLYLNESLTPIKFRERNPQFNKISDSDFKIKELYKCLQFIITFYFIQNHQEFIN